MYAITHHGGHVDVFDLAIVTLQDFFDHFHIPIAGSKM
jgi:hypothetical protein